MQMNPAVTELALYDVVNVPGVAADVSHINTRATVKVGSLILALLYQDNQGTRLAQQGSNLCCWLAGL